MQKLNIQNYHDKTEGMDKLNLELISAVKIFAQQNEIAMSKYKSVAISKLLNSIISDVKSNLLSIGAAVEVSNMIVCNNNIGNDDMNKLKSYYENNKINLEKIDSVLSAIVKQSNSNQNEVITDSEMIDTIKLIISSEIKTKNITLDINTCLRTKSYITGNINDIIFIICELIYKLTTTIKDDKISFILNEDEDYWYFKI
ncbi:MAG: hypothetical protein RSF67_09935, partial [Clostridia bacterium]